MPEGTGARAQASAAPVHPAHPTASTSTPHPPPPSSTTTRTLPPNHTRERLEGLGEGLKKRTAALYRELAAKPPWNQGGGGGGEDGVGGSPTPSIDEGEDPANSLLLAVQQKLFEHYHTVAYSLIIAAYFVAFCEYLYFRLYSLIFPERVVYTRHCEKHANETIVRNEFHYVSATVVFIVIGTFQLVSFFLLTISGKWLEVKRTFTNFMSMEERLHNELAFAIRRVMFLTVVPTFMVYFLCSTVVACDIFYMVGMRDPVAHLGSQIIIYFFDLCVLVYFVTFPLISLLYHPDIGCGVGTGEGPQTRGKKVEGRAKPGGRRRLPTSTTLVTGTSGLGEEPYSFEPGGAAEGAVKGRAASSPALPSPARGGENFPAERYSSLPLPTGVQQAAAQHQQQQSQAHRAHPASKPPQSPASHHHRAEPGSSAGQPLPTPHPHQHLHYGTNESRTPTAVHSQHQLQQQRQPTHNPAEDHRQPRRADADAVRVGDGCGDGNDDAKWTRRRRDNAGQERDRAVSSGAAAVASNLRQLPYSIYHQQRERMEGRRASRTDRYRRLSESELQPQSPEVATDRRRAGDASTALRAPEGTGHHGSVEIFNAGGRRDGGNKHNVIYYYESAEC